jgi:hypothetical protein
MEKINNILRNSEFRQIVKFELLKVSKKLKLESKKEDEKQIASDILLNSAAFLPKIMDLLCIDEKLTEIIDIEFVDDTKKELRIIRGSHQEINIDVKVPKIKYLGTKDLISDINTLIADNIKLMI